MSIGNLLTISEAAKEIGVSRQRMHELIKTYNLKTKPMKLGAIRRMIYRSELKKLPDERPTGVHVTSRAS